MAVWNIKAGGTRLISDGSSVTDDWTDANCFENNRNLHEWWRILRDHAVDGDEIIFYDEDDGVTEVVHDIEQGNLLSQVNSGTFTLRSRSNDKNQCSLRCLTDATLMRLQPDTTVGVNYTLRGLKFKEPVTGLTFSGATYFQLHRLCGDVVFDNCSIGNCQLGATADQLQGLVHSDDLTIRTVTYIDTVVENITSTATWFGGSYWMQSSDNTTVNIEGTFAVRDITLTPTNDIRGALWGNGELNISGDVFIDNINKTVNIGKFSRPVFTGGVGNVSVTGSITATNITAIGGVSGGQVITSSSPFKTDNISMDTLTISQGDGENSLGCVVVGTSATAQGSSRNVHGKNITGFSGGPVYYSDGAGGTADEVTAENIHLGENGCCVYSGGYGDMYATGITAYNCTAKNGAGFFAHNHLVSSNRNKVVSLRNATIVGCSVTEMGHGIWINNDNTTYTMDSSLINVIVRNGFGTDEINLRQGGGAALHTATIDSANIEGGISGVTSTASLTTTNIIDVDPLFVNEAAGDLRLSRNSPCIGIGIKWWGNGPRPNDATGEPLPDTEIDLGGLQSTWSPNHPKNL